MTNLQLTLDFLRDLARNNNRPWFEANRARYQQAAGAFEALVGDVISELGKLEDLRGVTPKDCIFRIYRDVRFAKDKSPYKPNMGAAIGPQGRNKETLGIYIHVEPGGHSFIANGLYEPDKLQLEQVRQQIAEDADTLRDILAAPEFVRWFGAMEGDQLKTAPQGYGREHPDIDLLRYKQFLALHHLTDAEVVQDGLLVERVIAARNAMQPFMNWLNEALEASS